MSEQCEHSNIRADIKDAIAVFDGDSVLDISFVQEYIFVEVISLDFAEADYLHIVRQRVAKLRSVRRNAVMSRRNGRRLLDCTRGLRGRESRLRILRELSSEELA
jgi:hypothetical protein